MYQELYCRRFSRFFVASGPEGVPVCYILFVSGDINAFRGDGELDDAIFISKSVVHVVPVFIGYAMGKSEIWRLVLYTIAESCWHVSRGFECEPVQVNVFPK